MYTVGLLCFAYVVHDILHQSVDQSFYINRLTYISSANCCCLVPESGAGKLSHSNACRAMMPIRREHIHGLVKFVTVLEKNLSKQL